MTRPPARQPRHSVSRKPASSQVSRASACCKASRRQRSCRPSACPQARGRWLSEGRFEPIARPSGAARQHRCTARVAMPSGRTACSTTPSAGALLVGHGQQFVAPGARHSLGIAASGCARAEAIRDTSRAPRCQAGAENVSVFDSTHAVPVRLQAFFSKNRPRHRTHTAAPAGSGNRYCASRWLAGAPLPATGASGVGCSAASQRQDGAAGGLCGLPGRGGPAEHLGQR